MKMHETIRAQESTIRALSEQCAVLERRAKVAANRPTALEIRLASVVVHLIEHIDTGELTDLQAADGVIWLPDVIEPLQGMYEQGLLPLRRDGEAPFAIRGGAR